MCAAGKCGLRRPPALNLRDIGPFGRYLRPDGTRCEVLWACVLADAEGSAHLVHSLTVPVPPNELTDKFALESDKLHAGDKASGVCTCPFPRSIHLIDGLIFNY